MRDKTRVFFLVGVFMLVFLVSGVYALGNPAASYCEQLGYDYEIRQTDNGESGFCMVDGEAFEEWAFYSGEEGAEYSYCAERGYKTLTKTDGENSYSEKYAVCLTKDNKEMEIPVDVEEEKISIDKMDATEVLLKSAEKYSYPDYFNWRDVNGVNYITTVKNQGPYPYCQAFTSIAGMEAQRNIETNNPDVNFDLSEQDLISCRPDGAEVGIVDEACLPYSFINPLTCSDKCSDWGNRVTKVSGFTQFFSMVEDDFVKSKISGGKVMDVVLSMVGSFDEDGIYRCDSGNSGNDHAILVVGYNETGQYWIAKNSWGRTWNGDGYFKIAYNNCYVWFVGYLNYYECQNGETQECSKKQGVCSVGISEMCVSNQWSGCNYNSIPNYENVESSCDGLDNDCDGQTDEGCAACNSKVDCGTDGWIGVDSCGSSINSIYNTFRTYTCNNPGEPSASCSSTDVQKVKTTCSFPQACITGSCQNYYGCFDDDAFGLLTKDKVVFNGLSYNDYCDAKGQLIEYICKSGKAKTQKIKCDCQSGACTTESVCVETDSGLDSSNLGTASLFNLNYTDYCDEKGRLIEYYCKKYNKVGTKKVKCNCVDGVCA